MSHGRRNRKMKQARRDALRAKKRRVDAVPEPPPDDVSPLSFAMENPWGLLMFASEKVEAAKPDPVANWRLDKRTSLDFGHLLQNFRNAPNSESAMLVALFSELLDDEALQQRYRSALDAYNGPLPLWAAGLREVEVHRAVRHSHVLGDFDELWIGARLADGREATCVVRMEHLEDSEIVDADLWVDAIDIHLRRSSNADFTTMDMSLADARAWIERSLQQKFVFRETATWPGCRPLVRWLVGHLPEGGDGYQWSGSAWGSGRALGDEFFGCEAGARFDRRDHLLLLTDLMQSGTGDPLRWSARRVEHVLESSTLHDHSLKVLLEVPALLRAFIPFAHQRSGIRDGLTAEALTALDGSQTGDGLRVAG
ncbi:hypothetical protein [Mycolicibacterium gilvum]|nr:hypothetical protein [Mycolicibacterium gilvum]